MRRLVLPLLALAILATACGSDSTAIAPASSTTAAPRRGAEPAYAAHGPYDVGYTALHMGEREVAVWYPTDAASVAGEAKATYDQVHPLPENLKAIVPPAYNTVVTMDAYADVPASDDGPFPVIAFSHGAGGYDVVYSGLTAGLASWGFVVVSVDYTERGLVAQVTGAGGSFDDMSDEEITAAAERDRRLMLAGVDLVAAENVRVRSPLHGAVDADRVAAVGQSAGGGTAFNALDDPRVKVAVGWAPVPPSGEPVDKPTMIIGAGHDIALTPAALARMYRTFPSPTRFIEVGGARAGHNTFTDVCTVIRGGGGLVQFARDNDLVSPDLLKLAVNGCAKTDMDPVEFWPVVQHFTVAQIRDTLGLDADPVGLDDQITGAFGEIPIDYQQR